MSRGRGSLYKQPKSPYWWVSYYVDGHQVRESTKTDNKKKAQKYLSEKVAANKIPDKRSIGHLLDGLVADYENNHRKGLDWCKLVVDVHLRPVFDDMKMEILTKKIVMDYMDARRKLGRKNATINREISLLRRAFTLAELEFPRIAKLAENNVRNGFLTPEQYAKLLHHLPEHIKPVFLFAYKTGCRRSEILKLTWSRVDLPHAIVRLEPGETKNNGRRTIPLTSDLVSVLEALPRKTEYVFTYHGKPIRSIKTAWKSACEAAGMPDLLFHDLRRTGVRNLVRSGVSEHVAMSISGHKTRAVFDRYNIVSEQDQREAVAKLEAAQSTLERQAENMLPAKMDKYLVSVEETEKSAEINETEKTAEAAEDSSAPQSDPEQN
jgi:integrase